MIYGIYHSADMDGICSAAILKYFVPDIELIPWDYGQPLPHFPGNILPGTDAGAHGDTIYIVDLFFGMDTMQWLTDNYRVIWIDHHISSIEKYNNANLQLDGLRSVKKSACELTWEFFQPGRECPTAVSYLGKYDTWRWRKDPDAELILRFQNGAFYDLQSPIDPRWVRLFEEDSPVIFAGLMSLGRDVLMVHRNDYRRACTRGQQIKFHGYNCIAINYFPVGPMLFESVADKYDICINYWWTGKLWKFSLYSREVDCVAIASQCGGGGHTRAAGFEISDLKISDFWENI